MGLPNDDNNNHGSSSTRDSEAQRGSDVQFKIAVLLVDTLTPQGRKISRKVTAPFASRKSLRPASYCIMCASNGYGWGVVIFHSRARKNCPCIVTDVD